MHADSFRQFDFTTLKQTDKRSKAWPYSTVHMLVAAWEFRVTSSTKRYHMY